MFRKIKKVISNPYFFSVISKIFCVAVGFLFTVFQSRYLGAEIKGQVATVNSIVSITTIIFGFGIYQAYPYYKRHSDADIMPIFMKIALGWLVLMLGLSGAAMYFLQLSHKTVAVLVITPLLVYDYIVSYITLVEEPNKRHVTDMAVMLGELILVIVLWLFAKPSFALGVLIIALKDITKAVIFTFWWRKRIFVHSEKVFTWLPKLIRFGFFPMLSLLMSTLNYRVNLLMLNGQVPDAMIGIYSVGIQIAERVWMIPDAMKGVLLSKLTKGKGPDEVSYVIRICNTACLAVILGLIVLGKPFIDFVFGAEYSGAYEIVLILLFGVFSMIYYRMIANYMIAFGKQKISFALLSTSVVINVAVCWVLIPAMGIYGAALASVISYTACSLLFIVYFCKSTGISFVNMLFLNRADIRKLRSKLKSDK